MHLGTISKQPIEKLPFDVSYSEVLGARSGTVGTPSTSVSGSGTVPTITDTTLSGSTFQFYVNGGTPGTYKLEITTSITVGGKVETVQDEISISVEEL